MNDQTWWAAQMDGSRAKYALCSGGFDAAGTFVHDGRVCRCDENDREDVEMKVHQLRIENSEVAAMREP